MHGNGLVEVCYGLGAGSASTEKARTQGVLAVAKILIVDDEPDVVDIVRFRLAREGHTILSANDGTSGIREALEHQPDLIVLDVMMPGVDGFQVLQQLKQDRRMARTAFIMLTARADFSSVAKGWNMDVDNYVTKPFAVDELADTVRNVLTYRGIEVS